MAEFARRKPRTEKLHGASPAAPHAMTTKTRKRTPINEGGVPAMPLPNLRYCDGKQQNSLLAPTQVMIEKAKKQTLNPYSEVASKCLQDLMDRHGVPRHKQSGVVTTVLGLSRSHGNRKLRGLFPMTLDEIGRIAEHFGETLLQALEPCLSHGMESAVMMVGDLEVPCEVMLGELLRPPFGDEKVVAIGVPGSYLVVPAQGLSLTARRIKRLLLRLEKARPKTADAGEYPAGKTV